MDKRLDEEERWRKTPSPTQPKLPDREVGMEAPAREQDRGERPARKVVVSPGTTKFGRLMAVELMMRADQHKRVAIMAASDLDYFLARYATTAERWQLWRRTAHRVFAELYSARRMTDAQWEATDVMQAKIALLSDFRARVRAEWSDDSDATDDEVLDTLHVILMSHARRGELLDRQSKKLKILRTMLRAAGISENASLPTRPAAAVCR